MLICRIEIAELNVLTPLAFLGNGIDELELLVQDTQKAWLLLNFFFICCVVFKRGRLFWLVCTWDALLLL